MAKILFLIVISAFINLSCGSSFFLFLYDSGGCDDCSQFNSNTGKCDLTAPASSRGVNCTFDCNCRSDQNLKCLYSGRVCSCQTGYKPQPGSANQCVPIQLGDACSSDDDCLSFGGFTAYQGACNNGKCGCDLTEQISTNTSLIDLATGLVSIHQICVTSGSQVDVAKGQACTVDPVTNSDFDSLRVCSSDLTCVPNALCPSSNLTTLDSNYDGTCRKVTNPTPTAADSNNCPANPNPSTVSTGVRKVGLACTADTNCGTNEVCSIPNTDPPCGGQCQCKDCFIDSMAFYSDSTEYSSEDDYGLTNSTAAGSAFCQPAMFLSLGSTCTGSMFEVIPDSMECDNGKVVQSKKTGSQLHVLGQPCRAESQCYGELTCDNPTNDADYLCDCDISQRWNATFSKCIPSNVGDSCISDKDCTEPLTCQSNAGQATCQP